MIARFTLTLASMFVVGLVHAAEPYIVKRGDNLTAIARGLNTSVRDMLVANGPYLLGKYEKTCAKKSTSYRRSPTRRGYFCNDAKVSREPVHANTLMAGWKLHVPVAAASSEITSIVQTSKGRRVALVVDATGSMGGNVQRVADEYRAALVSFGRDIIGVWLFSDGRVWQVKAEQLAALPTNGEVENTYTALLEAQRSHPDLIVLVTDEPGDDWPSGAITVTAPVIAHCLPEGGDGDYTCEPTLKRLVAVTGGTYVRGSDSHAASQKPAPANVAPKPRSAGSWMPRIFGN